MVRPEVVPAEAVRDVKGKPDRAYLKPAVGGADSMPAIRTMAVLIVNDQAHSALGMCLASVAEHLPDLQVYVYDDSAGGHLARDELSARYPAVRWVCGPSRPRFAATFNALVENVPSDADLLFLRANARVLGPLTRTKELLREPSVAAVSPLMRDNTPPGRTRWDCAIRRQTLLRSLVAAAGFSDSLRRTPLSLLYARQPSESEDIGGYLDSPCLAISRAAWNSIGGFDEEFFLHGESADWQARARAAGWRILLADELGVERVTPGPGQADSRRDNDVARTNTALLLEHHEGVRRADAYLAGTTLLDRLRRPKRDVPTPKVGRSRKDLPEVVIVTNRLVYGGAERQKGLLATELDRRGYPVTVVCVQRYGPVITEIPETVRVVRQPWWAPMRGRSTRPAVLVTGDTNTETGFGTLWRAGAANRRWLVAAHVPPADDGPIYSRPLTAAMNRADGFIVLAQRHWDMLVSTHRLRGPCFVAPNGVTLTGNPTPRIRPDDSPPHLVMLSRIVEHKNPHVLIDALSQLTDMPWQLSIFGDGPDRAMLEAKTPDHLRDRVHWRGWSAGPEPALADADLLCVPSRSEAFPLVILEAMARAVPVAASAVCAVPEMLDFGRAGYLVEPISVAGWRDQLARILADPGALPSVGQRGYDRMRQHYTVEAMTDAYVEAIEAVL